MDQIQRVQEIKEAIILAHPEFAPLVLSLPLVLREDMGEISAMTDGKAIYLNPTKVENMPDPQVAVRVAHESLHVGLLHCLEGRIHRLLGSPPPMASVEWPSWAEKKVLAGQAADYVVNPILKAGGFDVSEGLYDSQYEGMTWEEVYHKLEQKPQQDGDCELLILPGSEDSGDQAQQEHIVQMKQAMADFITLAKLRGTLPGNMLEQLANILKPEIPWVELLADWITVVCGREDYTWKRPSRRGLAVDLYLPSGIDQAVGCIGFGSDTSGSMSNEDCSKAVTSVIQAGEAVKIKKYVWVEGDAAVQRVLEFDGHFEPPRDVKGRGGTDFRPIIEELLKHSPVCIVYFTDLEGRFPDREPPVPVIWVTTNQDGQAPWGKVVRIK